MRRGCAGWASAGQPRGGACLTPAPRAPIACRARRPDGRCRRGSRSGGGGKSGLHGKTVPANGRRGRPQGKCHRKQTARAARPHRRAPRARVKRCGKSAPRPRQRGRQGKPHREQDRIGTAGGPRASGGAARGFPPRRPGWSREACREARPRGMTVSRRSGQPGGADRTRLTGRLAPFPSAATRDQTARQRSSSQTALPSASSFSRCASTLRSAACCRRGCVCE